MDERGNFYYYGGKAVTAAMKFTAFKPSLGDLDSTRFLQMSEYGSSSDNHDK